MWPHTEVAQVHSRLRVEFLNVTFKTLKTSFSRKIHVEVLIGIIVHAWPVLFMSVFVNTVSVGAGIPEGVHELKCQSEYRRASWCIAATPLGSGRRSGRAAWLGLLLLLWWWETRLPQDPFPGRC